MTVAHFVASIARAGGYLSVTADGGIDYVGPESVLTDAVRDEIRLNKSAIVAWLRTPFSDQPVVDQLALDYERTLPDWLIERIHETWGRDISVGGPR